MAVKTYKAAADDWLRRQGVRVTSARVEILGMLLEAESPLTHQQMAALLARYHRRVDPVTLYRVLEWLVEKGFAHRVAGADRVWRFAAIREEDGTGVSEERNRHPHFHCIICNRVTCLPASGRGWGELTLPPGFESYAFHLIIEGQCAACRYAAEAKAKNENGT